ncbi:MAG: NADH-quinone oxidoreductase subunit K [Thiohalocapsa sp.]
MTAQFLYGGAGMALFVLGVWSFLVHEPLLRKLIALNIMGGGVFHVLIAVAYRGGDTAPDPVPHALVLTGIVVAVSATALALALGARLDALSQTDRRDAGSAATRPAPSEQPRESAGGLAGDA